jgi:RND family efflux transporter MFP subunit
VPLRLAPILALLLIATAAAEPPPTLVTAEPAMREVSLTGFTRARAELPLVAEVAGRVEEVAHQIGEAIGPQGLFARIDDSFLRLELEEVAIEQERVREQIDYDTRELRRYQALARQSSASQAQVDTLEQTLRNNRQALRVLEVKERVLAERLARTRVRAPAGWLVTARNVEPGQWVREGDVIGAAADFSTLLVPFALTPEQYAALPDESIALDLPELGLRVPASAYRINPGFDPATRKIAVELAVVGDISPRRGGLRALLTLALPERTGAVLLPAAAVEERYEEAWVTREDGARIRVTLLGSTEDGQVRLAGDGIRPGDRFRLPAGD